MMASKLTTQLSLHIYIAISTSTRHTEGPKLTMYLTYFHSTFVKVMCFNSHTLYPLTTWLPSNWPHGACSQFTCTL